MKMLGVANLLTFFYPLRCNTRRTGYNTVDKVGTLRDAYELRARGASNPDHINPTCSALNTSSTASRSNATGTC